MATKHLNQYMRDIIVRAVMNDVPRPNPDDIAVEIQAAFYSAMKPEMREFEKRFPGSLHTRSLGGDYGLGHPYRKFVIGNLTQKQIDKALEPFINVDKNRGEAERNLKSALAGMRTEEQVRKAFPELEKYLTAPETSSTNLPALANVMAGLAKLGWPKKKE